MSSNSTALKSFRSQEAIVAILTICLVVAFSLFVPGFLSAANLLGLLQASVTLGLLGLGMGIVVIARGIDLSMIAVMSVSSAMVIDLVSHGHSAGAGFVSGLGLAIVFGLLNGLVIAIAELPALFVTLASGLALYGAGVGILKYDILMWSTRLVGFAWIGRSNVAGIPMPLIALALLLCLATVFLKWTRLGDFVYAMGDNPQGARAVGIPTKRIIVMIYIISALIAFATGIILSAVLGAATIRVYNSTLMYDVILVVVLGGIGLSGGRGSMLSVLLGTLLIATFGNAMTLMDAGYAAQNFFKGMLLLAAIIFDSRLNPRNEETAQQGDI